ncbi:methylmalonic aciduria and homocystinuria type D protein [Calothrix sp. UHCC 0171]|uniref:methylmalonic aciduria and homocystinuria type D protein n=1 Tax=Calothrix sp. UHCC 0171 TaxID=3110245 RepID=UPI002B1FD5BE|nr:methylmalonic aciduria and homocystinuria type D protein [Calothrix sp. UHCC 0171]MEA5572767.1 methylmalonic aciduria and homocystinuria type D protein [Calothrix sp. UHCC 0171]
MDYFRISTSDESCLINWVGEEGQAVQISIHSPSEYICTNRERILPDWRNSTPMWVVVVLMRSHYDLLESNVLIEAEKQVLRERFMRFGLDVAFNLRDMGYMADIIDPRTGYPLLSRPGQVPHNDTAVIEALLNYSIIKNKCRVLVHPQWGTCVYPGILLSEAPPIVTEWILKDIAKYRGWQEVKKKQAVNS